MFQIKIDYDNLKFLKKENIFKYTTNKYGKKVCILGSVHGNEIAGIVAIKEIIHSLNIDNGEVYLILCNEKAMSKNVRFIEEDLNRCFLQNKLSTDSYEENLAKELKPILSQFDICLDIHNSNSKDTEPFIICEKNAYNLIDSIKVNRVVSGFDKLEPGGTDYYMNMIGKIGICVECGYAENKESISFAKKIIINFLKKTNNIYDNSIEYIDKKEFYNLYKVYISINDFILIKDYKDFEVLRKGQLIGLDGNLEIASEGNNSVILFAHNTLKNSEREAFLLADRIEEN